MTTQEHSATDIRKAYGLHPQSVRNIERKFLNKLFESYTEKDPFNRALEICEYLNLKYTTFVGMLYQKNKNDLMRAAEDHLDG